LLRCGPTHALAMAGAYTAACTSAGCRVLSDVTDAYNSGSPELALAGNKSQELKEKRLVDLDMAPLAVALEENNPFPKLDFSYNLLGVGGAESLRKLVASDGTCTALDLSQNNLNPAASKALFSGLRQNQTLKELRLSGNKLGNLGGMELADLLQKNHALEELHLSNCELDTAALVALATVMRDNRSVRVLDVSRPLAKTLMDEPALHFARMLKVNQTLTDLDMSKAGMSDLGLQRIAEEVFRAGAASKLEKLRLSGNKIQLVSDDCVGALAMLLGSAESRLKTLILGTNPLRDEGALKLADIVQASRGLERLDVSACSITSKGLCSLARAIGAEPEGQRGSGFIEWHPTISLIELWGNRFDSAACLAWIPALTSEIVSLDVAVQQVDGAYHCVQSPLDKAALQGYD